MSKAEIILEYSDDQYKLNEEVLRCIISKSEECQKISLISIVGRKISGKSFLLNCLINYLTSPYKETWPEFYRIEFNQGFFSNSNSSKPKIEMWSEPFIIEEGTNKIAIFLMDSSDVFNYEFGSSSSKIMDDILELFMYTSSTLFYSMFHDIADQQISHMQNFLENFKYEPCTEEIVYQISCTNQEIIKNGFCYGYDGGNKFIQSKANDLKSENYLSQIKCCLWPNISRVGSESSYEFIMNMEDKNELSKIVHSEIFDIKTIQSKNICKVPISAKELISLFIKFVEALNTKSQNILATSLVSKLPFKNNVYDESGSDDYIENLKKKIFFRVLFESNYAGQKLKEYHDIFCSDYQKYQRKSFKDPNFESDKTVAKNHNMLKMHLLTKYDIYFKTNFPKDLFDSYRNELFINLDQLKEDMQIKANNFFSELESQYQESVDSAINLYKLRMNHGIVEMLKCESPSNVDFLDINNQSEHASINLYIANDPHMKPNNIALYNKFSSVLKDMLTLKKNDFIFAWKVLKENKLRWNSILKEKMYFDSSYLEYLNSQFENHIPISLKNYDVEIQTFILEKIEQNFDEIQKRNQYIIDCELNLVANVTTFMNQIFSERLIEKLKSQLFERPDVNIMFENLLRHSRNIVRDLNQLNDKQKFECDKLLRDNSENILIELSQKYFDIVNLRKNHFRRAKEEALEKCNSDMTSYIKSALYIDEEDYVAKSLNIHDNAIFLYEDVSTSKFEIKDRYIKNLYYETLNELEAQIQEEIIKFKQTCEEKISQLLSIAIHFGHFISAGFYANEINYIYDESKEFKRYNAVAFNQNILFGNDAKAFNDKVLTHKGLDIFFDIKRLLAKNKSLLNTEELSHYPYDFQDNSTKIEANINGNEEKFEIETLISMIVLNIITDAKKSTTKIIKRAVFTIPTSYDLRQKNLFKDIGKISGLSKIEILSEMTALAIGYAHDIERDSFQNEITPIFVILNGFELDIAIINIIGKKIVYKSYINFNIKQFEKTYSTKQILVNFNKSCSFMEKFLKCVNEVLNLAQIKKEDLKEIIFSGQSLMCETIKKTLLEHFKPVQLKSPSDLILNGSIIYSRIPKDNDLEISEVTKCQYNMLLKCKWASDFKSELIEKNAKLPIVREKKFEPPSPANFPIELYVKQNNNDVSYYEIVNLPTNKVNKYWTILFSFTSFGEINISSNLISESGYSKEVEWVEHKLGLSEKDINKERNKLSRILQKMNGPSITINSKQLNEQISKLTKYCDDIDKSLENECKNISRIKKKQIMKSVSEARKFLTSDNFNIDTISEQYSKLEETYNFFKS